MAGRKDQGPTQRALSIGEMVRKALTEILAREELNDPVLKNVLVSVSEVRMSTDLKLGTAFVTILGQTEIDAYVDALNRQAKFFRGKLGPALRQMKHMPEVRFRPDTSFDNYARIDALLRSPEVARDLEDDEEKE
jgi:ribosome-binding factor A